MKKLKTLTPFLFDNHLIIAFSSDWLHQFKQLPEFDVFIDDERKLHLVSRQVIDS